jgi:alpha-beta hydrolase superfamily lysophospholipase
MKTNTLTLAGHDGQPFFVRGWSPESKPKAVVQLAHGMAEHTGRYQWFAERLTAAGYALYADDHRGHGETAQLNGLPHGHTGVDSGWEAIIKDGYVLNRHIAAQHPGLPIVYIGHSMGSHIGQTFGQRYGDHICGLLLCGSTGKVGPLRWVLKLIAQVERIRIGARGRSPILRKVSFEEFNKPFQPSRTPADWLSRDEAQVDSYNRDPWCGYTCSTQFWMDFVDGLSHNESDKNFRNVPKDLPIRLITGGADSSNKGEVGVRSLEKRYLVAGVKDVEVQVYPDARHELFNETNRVEVLDDTIAWLDKVTGS